MYQKSDCDVYYAVGFLMRGRFLRHGFVTPIFLISPRGKKEGNISLFMATA
jgi:hypothetical protein